MVIRKRKMKKLALLLVTALMVGTIGVGPVSSTQEAAAKVKLTKKKITLAKGGKVKLTLKSAKGKKVKWSSSNSKVASVSKGTVTAKGVGTADITATYNKKSYKCVVTVKEAAKLSYTSTSVRKGKSKKLQLTGSFGKVVWKSSKSSIVSVKKGVIKGKKPGQAKITAANGGRIYSCTVSVIAAKKLGFAKLSTKKDSADIKGIHLQFSPGTIDKNSNLVVSKVSGTPKRNGAKTVSYDFSLKGATVKSEDLQFVSIEIPYKSKSATDKNIRAALFNEYTGKYESVPAEYKDGKVTLMAPHFSVYAISEDSTVYDTDGWSRTIKNDNTSQAYIEEITRFTPDESKLDQSVAGLVANMGGGEYPIDDAIAMLSPALFEGAAGAANGLAALMEGYRAVGCVAPLETFTAWGSYFKSTALLCSLYNLAYCYEKYGADSDKFRQISASLGTTITTEMLMWAVSDQGANAAFFCASGAEDARETMTILRTRVSPVVCAWQMFIAIIAYSINSNYSMMIEKNQRKYLDMYKAFYKEEMPRDVKWWRNFVEQQSAAGKTPNEVAAALKAEIDSYAGFFFSHEEEIALQYSEQQRRAWGFMGGYSDELKNAIETSFKYELCNGTVKAVWDWFAQEAEVNAFSSACKSLTNLARKTCKMVHLNFYDENAKGFSNMNGYTIRLKDIPENIKDPQNLSCKLGSRGTGSFSFNSWAAKNYHFSPVIEIVDTAGNVVKEQGIEWKFGGNMIPVGLDLSYDLSEGEIKLTKPEDSVDLSLIETRDGVKTTVPVENWTISGSNKDCIKLVNNGGVATITPVKNGKAIVSCNMGKQVFACPVTVEMEDIIALTHTAISIPDIEKKYTLALEKTPAGEPDKKETLKVDWVIQSGDKDCVDLSPGKNGVLTIKGLKNGTVTVACVYEEKTYSCTITVEFEGFQTQLSKTYINLEDNEKGQVLYYQTIGKDGKITNVKAKFTDWETSDPSKKIFTMEDNGDGGVVILGNAPGTGKVTMYDATNKRDLICEIEVGKIGLSFSSIKIDKTEEGFFMTLDRVLGGKKEKIPITNWSCSGSCFKGTPSNGGISVKGVEDGTGKITCTYREKTYSCPVTVALSAPSPTPASKPTSMDITMKSNSGTDLTIREGSGGNQTIYAYTTVTILDPDTNKNIPVSEASWDCSSGCTIEDTRVETGASGGVWVPAKKVTFKSTGDHTVSISYNGVRFNLHYYVTSGTKVHWGITQFHVGLYTDKTRTFSVF